MSAHHPVEQADMCASRLPAWLRTGSTLLQRRLCSSPSTVNGELEAPAFGAPCSRNGYVNRRMATGIRAGHCGLRSLIKATCETWAGGCVIAIPATRWQVCGCSRGAWQQAVTGVPAVILLVPLQGPPGCQSRPLLRASQQAATNPSQGQPLHSQLLY